jgi:hypothetical protein
MSNLPPLFGYYRVLVLFRLLLVIVLRLYHFAALIATCALEIRLLLVIHLPEPDSITSWHRVEM